MFQNYGGYPPQPQYIFVPTPGAQQPSANPFDINGIAAAIQGLEMLKKQFKEEKKEDNKKKHEMPSTFGIVALLLLMSPFTGPIVFRSFQWGAKVILGG